MERKRKMPRLQFSLRTILVLISLTAICFAYLLRQDAARRRLITDIEGIGGTVKFDESMTLTLFKSQRVDEVMIPYQRIPDLGLMRLKFFPNLSTLGLKDFDFAIKGGGRIQGSEIRFTKLNDEILKEFASQHTNDKSR